MPYTGADADSDLKNARDAIAQYMTDNLGNLSPQGQTTLDQTVTQIDLKRQVIAIKGVLDGLDPTGQLFPKITSATQNAQNTLDNLQRIQQTITKALGIATAVLGLATAIEGGDALAIGASCLAVNTACT